MHPPSRRKDAKPQPTVAGSWLHSIVRTLDALGFDGREIALEAGVSRRALQNPTERLPEAAVTALWHAAEEATGDPAIGFTVARHLTPATFGALSYSVLASVDLRSVFLRLRRYQRLLSDAIEIRFERNDDRYEWSVERLSTDGPPDQGIDGFFAVIVRTVRGLTSPRVVEPILVSLRRPQPADPTPYTSFFRGPVHFGADRDRLGYHPRDVEARLPDGNRELADRNDRIVDGLLSKLSDRSVAEKVRKILLATFADGPTEQIVARKLGMSKSNLHLALSREDTTYRYILNELREELARRYLETGDHTIKEIAFLLGFADATTFSRAFKRWTGSTPYRYAKGPRIPQPDRHK